MFLSIISKGIDRRNDVSCALLPLQLASGLSAIGQGASFIGQQNATNQYNAAAKQNAINASLAAQRQYEDEGRRYFYNNKQNLQQGFQTEMKARQARGTAVASAGTAGIDASSISVQSILNDIDQQQAANDGVLRDKQEDAESAFRSRVDSYEAQAQGRINSMPFKEGPSPLALGLGIADAGLDSFSSTKYGKNWLGISS